MRFQPTIPFVKIDPTTRTGTMQTFYRYITFNRTNRRYTTFRYYAACRLFARLSKGELPTWPTKKSA